MKTFLITGGAGFIGTNLTRYLHTRGHSVIVADNLHSGKRENVPDGVSLHIVDVRDTEVLARLCVGIDVVVHLAALPPAQFSIDNPVVAHDFNVNGTLSVLEAAKTAGVKKVVFAASASAYGDHEVLPLSPSLPARPKSPYALHKYYGECMMKLWSELYGLKTVSLRFFNVYGPHLDPTGPYALVLGRFIALAREHKPLTITGTGEQTRDFIHVEDIARAIEQASLADSVGNGEVLNVGSGVGTSINALAHLFGGDIQYVPPRIEPLHSVADINLTTSLLNWQPTIELSDGIEALKKEFGL